MSIFTHGDICRYICTYLSFEDTCMFRRCSWDLHTFITGNLFYERKTAYLKNLSVTPSRIMAFTPDIDYRRYLKKRGWRAICPAGGLQSICSRNVKLARYLMKTQPDKLYGGHYRILMRTKNRELIDLSVEMTYPSIRRLLFEEILLTRDDELISWFEEKHVGDRLFEWILELRPIHLHQHYLGGAMEIMWKRYGLQYRHLFYPRADTVTGKLLEHDVLFAVDKGIFSCRVNKEDINDNSYITYMLRQYGYIEEGDYYIRRD